MKKILLLLLMTFLALPCAFAEEAAAPEENNAVVYDFKAELEEVQNSVNETLKRLLPGAKVESIEEYYEEGADEPLIKCKITYMGLKMAFVMNPKTGSISHFVTDNGSFVLSKPVFTPNKASVQLTKFEVNRILKKVLPEAKIQKVKYDNKSGIISGRAEYGGDKYDFEIDAAYGSVIKMDKAAD